VTAAERGLLREVFRWVRSTQGVGLHLSYAYRWAGAEKAWGVDCFTDDDGRMTIWRLGKTTGKDYWVVSVAEAVDVLCALGILPPRFSTAYRAAIADMAGAT
jgi:hypothetical protein